MNAEIKLQTDGTKQPLSCFQHAWRHKRRLTAPFLSGADWLKREVSLYAKAADGWHKWLATAKLSEAEQRQVNDRALLVERALLQQASLSGRPTFRHLVFSPQVSNAYAGKGFPVVHDLVYRIGRLKPGPERERLWRQVRAFVNQACIAIRAAHTLLSPDLALPLAA
ncbi:hypothetical protein HPB48_012955 [Haemaphysalis longicornis]|uniref:Transferrin receptor-like dimerisation domain-containing protein n=1 Tax=Haemaphysalis longicornis TaxID=44386 RepID=A0A9J6GNV2_HAELO|nr:hypothetical protein HPB48_012955 [Haemaphysalis longicornis]